MAINHLAVIGVGLIGGSLARALKSRDYCRRITGSGRHQGNLEKAVALGVIDDFSLNPADAVRGADVVLLATPLATTAPLCRALAPGLGDGAIVTDAGSAKMSVIEAARAALPAKHFPNFVPGHPIAGTEKSGVEASFAELFEKHLVILTPLPETAAAARERVADMWRTAGAEVIDMPPGRHDEVLAATSHLPHLLAYALVDCLARMQEREEIFRFAAGGFAGFTRIASSSPEMWHDICISNRDALLRMVDRFGEHLGEVRVAVERGDSARLLEIFARAKHARDEFSRKRAAGSSRNDHE
ncbi:MAG TPA: prephenate dehydrogenase/arogenate dehydrogenase family protein [Gammaproteobacteria bacterium]|jgi:prephenate dehydrogenase